MPTHLNQNFIAMVCLMFKLTDRQLDLLEGPFMFIARPILAVIFIVVVSYWLITDIGVPKLKGAIQNVIK